MNLSFDNQQDKLEDIAKKCSLSKPCPPDSYAFHLWSGAANIVGPKICFDGKILMSHVVNNIGPGINIVVINNESGVVVKLGFLNMENGNKDSMLDFLKTIPPGSIVLLASFRDVIPRMTDEMRDVFEEMGSTMVKSLKSRDGWVFAGKMGAKEKSIFEKVAANDKDTNLYDEWPRVVEIGGCYPKKLSSEYASAEDTTDN
ncbi:protein FAM3C [Halichoeres trimaculatus]|uniref:protein FAM3C n=1 Tax=Halichoeres trimaculatus TaxID=147232 RepID=UPI003D9E0D26